MTTWLRALALVTPVLAALACGGNLDSGNGDHNQVQACPAPSALVAGGTCSTAEQVCAASTPGCDGTFDCTCTSGTWSCPQAPVGATCQTDANACPASSAVVSGDACDLPNDVTCASDIPIKPCFDAGGDAGYVMCDCTAGSWLCGTATPACVDGGTCPAPASITIDSPCKEEGQVCAGNPQECGGEVIYDDMVCEDGGWTPINVPACNDPDSGPPDSGPPDSGPPDSGEPDEGIVDAGIAPGRRPGR
jgi:hypothetical protein